MRKKKEKDFNPWLMWQGNSISQYGLTSEGFRFNKGYYLNYYASGLLCHSGNILESCFEGFCYDHVPYYSTIKFNYANGANQWSKIVNYFWIKYNKKDDTLIEKYLYSL